MSYIFLMRASESIEKALCLKLPAFLTAEFIEWCISAGIFSGSISAISLIIPDLSGFRELSPNSEGEFYFKGLARLVMRLSPDIYLCSINFLIFSNFSSSFYFSLQTRSLSVFVSTLKGLVASSITSDNFLFEISGRIMA